MTGRTEGTGGGVDPVERWRRLLDGVDVDDAVDVLEIVADATGDEIGAMVGAAVDGVFSAQLSSDDSELGDAVERLLPPLIERAAAEEGATATSGRGLVAAAVLLAGQGGPDPRSVLADVAPAALATLATVSDENVVDWALACVALGADDDVLRFVGGAIAPFEPGLAFGPDKPSFARYLVAAAAAGASAEDVNAAWTSFVADFPDALEARSVRWSCLLHAGYAVYTRFAGYPREEVVTAIRSFVHAVAEA